MSNIKLYSEHLDCDIQALDFVKENAYCKIFQAKSGDDVFILKEYKGETEHLVLGEAKAIDVYHSIVKNSSCWLDCRVLQVLPEKKLLAISFVPGERLSKWVYGGNFHRGKREYVLERVRDLGQLLREFYLRTRKAGEKTASFFYEYLEYCSKRLAGKWMMDGGLLEDAKALIHSMQRAEGEVCFCHGDFVPRNIHVLGDKIGLVDFANSNGFSHFYNDFCNFRFALGNMLISRIYRRKILHAFHKEIEDISVGKVTKDFYHEYHRRRWLLLKIISKNPLDWLQFMRGYFSFARANHGI